ncbi:hypothetical protein KSP39_PZI012874 [Platanthera zijinensis]|uniref:C2 domain-containing protein n=1 Tax=Platanthera zijinensis TaxID=2320716 RepID=A0AAP0BC81_9ASPA
MVCLMSVFELLPALLIHPSLPSSPSQPFPHLKKAQPFLARHPCNSRVLISTRWRNNGFSSVSPSSTAEDDESSSGDVRRPPFDLNLAVVLAGFAFEAYTSPAKEMGWREIDAAQCQTVILSNSFLREMYDGQLFIKLRNGEGLPAMDLWGTSDPYVIFQLDGQVVKSNVKWATNEPTWNEEFTLNIKSATKKNLQVAVWDANLVASHKRLGNGLVNLDSLCDGNLHEVMVELEGIGGGGKIYFEVKYKNYDQIYEEKQWWRLPFVSDFLFKGSLGSTLTMALGSESLNTTQFVQSAFGLMKSFNLPSSNNWEPQESLNVVYGSSQALNQENENDSHVPLVNDADGNNYIVEQRANDYIQSEYFWKSFTDIINQAVFQKLGVSLPEINSWDGLDLLDKMSTQLRRSAEEKYVEFGLATPESSANNNNDETGQPSINGTPSSSSDIRKASGDLLNQMEVILGALMVLATPLSKQKNDLISLYSYKNEEPSNEKGNDNSDNEIAVGENGEEEMKELFSSAESAMEAWAMLATSLGSSSFIKSDFEKICFLDNASTDTQVAIWRDSARRRFVVAFRGTEQSKWKDLLTDLMLLPAGMNPERLGGEFKQEVQVHGGFLNAYDSVRIRILMLIKVAICFDEDQLESMLKWHVYVTGHSLGGALATLLALELSTSQMAKHGVISVTMYNFGSPRVGNRRFTDLYNAKVKDSWRVVNHRDIIPTVPRLMGYCHVAQPVYLAAGDIEKVLLNDKFRTDGYDGDVIGEATPDVLVSEFMKGEKQLIEKILQTEINLLQSIRDGTALMQHMEDFYYTTLLETVRSNYTLAENSKSNEERCQ